jgi:phosphoenolpyruvate-protein kinase (PTS system EI component)
MGDPTPAARGRDVQAEIDALKTATREAHEALRDLRAERKALDNARRTLSGDIKQVVESMIEERVAAGLASYAETVTAAMDSAVAKVHSEFNRLERIFTGREDPSRPDLETLIRAYPKVVDR